MCTVVVRRSGDRPGEVLAVRDELTGREFDDPGRWWPELPDVVGGRDRVAGGTWCATDVGTGVTALVLNRYHERTAAPGAPSRGVLPLLGVVHGAAWVDHVALTGMAGFLLVLVAPDRLTSWEFDGEQLTVTEHPEGTHVFTSGGPEDRKGELWRGDLRGRGLPGPLAGPGAGAGAGAGARGPRRPPRAGGPGVRHGLRRDDRRPARPAAPGVQPAALDGCLGERGLRLRRVSRAAGGGVHGTPLRGRELCSDGASHRAPRVTR